MQRSLCDGVIEGVTALLKDYDIGTSRPKDEIELEIKRFTADMKAQNLLELLPGTVIGFSLRTRKWGTQSAFRLTQRLDFNVLIDFSASRYRTNQQPTESARLGRACAP
jgi:hypothetical protein